MTSALTVNGFSMTGAKPPPPADQTGVVVVDKNKEWQMELLMEKLRSKASSFKTLVETAKNIRMAMLDKRFGIDSVEKSQLQKSLDTLQHSIKVTSLQSMIERLESLSRQLGLKFMTPATGMSTELFISSDMFFLEILLEPSGAVKDVKIHHEGKAEQQSCEELVACLSRGDFVDFTAQLEGLASIYQLNADKKVKCKAFSALQSLETDLGILAQLQTFMKEPFNLVHKSPVGILERRKGGHAMKLTYFVSPYDLIDQESKSCEALSLEAVISKKVGHSVTVCMEGSTAHKLPTSSIITLNRGPSGKSTPLYAPLTNANSSMLPACFVLKLATKMPMCTELIRRIQKVTDLECTDISATAPLLSMIVQHASDKQLDCQHNKELAVSLPDQQHCYFMTENRVMEGVLVGSIPFTHPGHVPQILNYLRQQALFNTLITSCVRPMSKADIENMTVFEVSALSWQCISVSLEHPFEETLATAELDLSDISAVKCKLYGSSLTNVEQTSDLAGKVLQRCLSIPLTMRTLIKTWEGRTFSLHPQNGGSNNFNNSLGTGREQNNPNGSSLPEFGNSEDIKIKQEPGTMNGTGNSMGRQQQQQQLLQTQQSQQQQSFLDAGAENSIGFPSYSGSSDTPPTPGLNPLTLTSSSTPPPSTHETSKGKKSRKRKTGEASWKSPKRKSDFETSEILLDSSSSDSTPMGTPTSKDGARTPTPTLAASGSLDLSNVDPLEILSTDRSSDYDMDNEPEVVQIVEPSSNDRKFKRRSEDKSPNLFDEGKSLVSPSVSITPISSSTSSYNSMLSTMGLERRPGIEIIPITSLAQTPLPSSITITAINNPNKPTILTDERSKDRKSSKSRSLVEDVKSKLEKKRKRKRDSSPMGPPEKLPLKQDPLSKPVSVSIRPSSESPPSSTSRPSSPATTLTRKFSPSPTHNKPLVLVGKSSPTSTSGLKQSSSSSSGAGSTSSKNIPSPRHSPVYSSPKHMSSGSITSNISPKHGTSSPKHGNSGKPSMSSLKSASSSPSGKTESTSKTKLSSPSSSSSVPSSSSTSEDSKDKDRKSSIFSGSSPKSKSVTPKSKTIDQDQQSSTSTTSGNVTPTGSTTPPADASKSLASQQQARNRKGSLSAVIDKLKNAQHCSDDLPAAGSNLGSSSPISSTSSSQPAKSGPDAKNPTEYMVKPSSDGMKLTINKTRTKDSKGGGTKVPSVVLSGPPSGIGASTGSSSSGATSGTKTTYTGLKPGVVAGPASRKSQAQTPPKVRSNSPLTSSGSASSAKANLSGSGQKVSGSGMKSSSSSNLLSSSGLTNKGSSSKSSSFSSRDKARFKPGDKSFSSKESENEKAFKLLAAHASSMGGLPNIPGMPPKLVVEGLMKQLDTNFQIPKLSARANADSTDKRSSDKVDSGSKSSDNRSTTPSTIGAKTDETFGNASSTLNSDMPTNLSMQLDDNSSSKSELSGGRSFVNLVGDAGSKDSVDLGKAPYAMSGDSASSMESLNLAKGSDKYKSPEDKDLQQHPSFQRLSQADKKLVESITSSASVTLTPLPPPSTQSSGSSTPQEAAEMLLDFSTPRESVGGGGGTKSSMPFPASTSPAHKNTTPPPPPPPPPLPPPPPPSVSPAVIPSSVSPISSFPASPSVSVHIVKSPAPSPRVNPLSPHSASPCITDDELMDEALVGR